MEQELDLVEISPDATPPVAKIVDWGKYNYQRTKQLQKNRRNTKSLDLKQMRSGLKIGDHDLAVKLKKVMDLLNAGHKVNISLGLGELDRGPKKKNRLAILASLSTKYYLF